MSAQGELPIPSEQIRDICRRHRVRELALFGSVARNELRPDSDVDLLVEFDPDARVGFLALAQLTRELAAVFGRAVDLAMKDGLKPALRDRVLAEARVLYAIPPPTHVERRGCAEKIF